jgi:hypothetical protein
VLQPLKRGWSKVLIEDLETTKVGHTVVKADARAMVTRAKHWLKRTLQAQAGSSGGGSSGDEALASSEEEDWEAAAAAGRARVQRVNESAVPEEDLLAEVRVRHLRSIEFFG